MEHLDLAGLLTTPINWNVSAFDQQDAIYLSSSRQMLEPILEETSEDEEYAAQSSWNPYENATSFWTGAESETGSIIRIEVHKDADSISERDFACPAKRARRSDEFLVGGSITFSAPPQSLQLASGYDDAVLLRKPQRDYGDIHNSLERFLAYEVSTRDSWGSQSQQRSSAGSRRFEDFYSDSDSYNSLSRSSSLIQFESLERQLTLQEQHASNSSLGHSSPSLLSFDGAYSNNTEEGARSSGNSGSNSGSNSRRGSQSSLLKRIEPADGRLHQTYFDLNKLNFGDEHKTTFGVAGKTTNVAEAGTTEPKSDSESSTASSGNSSENSILRIPKPSTEDSAVSSTQTMRIAAYQHRGKSSAENLSEDSGYGEPSTLRRSKSKSLPKNFDKFCEEEEEYQQQQQYEYRADELDEALHSQNTHSRDSTIIHYVDERDICQPKINDATFIVESNETESALYDDDDDADADDVVQRRTRTPPMATYRSPLASPSTVPTTPLLPDTLPCLLYDRIKNRPTLESTIEQRRSLAHSPSPVSSDASTGSSSCTDRSSTSASTCASAASFTWLPIRLQQQQQQRRNQTTSTLGELGSELRNSLPDIRDAIGTTSLEYFSPYNYTHPVNEGATDGYGLEQLKTALEGCSRGRTATGASIARARAIDDSDTTTTTEAEVRKRGVFVSVGAVDRGDRAVVGGYANGCARISSVPNELNKLGRRKRATKVKYSKSNVERAQGCTSSSSEAESEEDFFDDIKLKLRRSCSWSERQLTDLHKSEEEESSVDALACGYMNASYQDLTQLDYTAKAPHQQQQGKYVRQDSMEEARKSSGSGDYESLICKGNFLLDELSEIYDRNASILTDKPKEMSPQAATGPQVWQEPLKYVEVARSGYSPRPPVRQRKHSNSSYSDLDGSEYGGNPELPAKTSPRPPPRQRGQSNSSYSSDLDTPEIEVQHVQLTIRKPPARQKRGRESEETNSLVSELPPTFSSFGKTFDQDPTNLRTSYAQSLEKCNFDAKEVSTTDYSKARAMPKRRFQSQANSTKKRNMVSSTPNLNAYDPNAGEDVEDEIFVSSAHTSMHQLPQNATQKPLGILIPAGSRTSFGKEVSFCPIVSKYSWQEQSSEECNEPQLHRQDGQEMEESDDELLDNADATVIYNTKENELVAARYSEERGGKQKEQKAKSIVQVREQPQVEKVRATLIVREAADKENIESKSEQPESETSHSAGLDKPTTKLVSAPEPVEYKQAEASASAFSTKPTTVDLTATSENKRENACVDHLDSNRQSVGVEKAKNGQQSRPLSIQLPILSEPPINRAHHILYASQQMLDDFERREREYSAVDNRMSNYSENVVRGAGGAGATMPVKSNNNNEIVKNSKFKADEKHPSSKGFLSRMFRFSLRRNKKKHQQKDQNLAEQNSVAAPKSNGSGNQANGSSQKSGTRAAVQQTNGNSTPEFAKIGANYTVCQQSHQQLSTATKVTGKPPLPKLPPRTSSMAQSAAAAHAQYQQQLSFGNDTNFTSSPSSYTSATSSPRRPQQPTAQFYTDDDFLVAERSYYRDFENQLNSGMQANGCAAGAPLQAPPLPVAEFASPSRGSVSQKAQMFNNLQYVAAAGHPIGNGRIVAAAPGNRDNSCKIGLIETNLDTHETVISGKTRSLMDIGPQQAATAPGYGKYGKRMNMVAAGEFNADVDDVDVVYVGPNAGVGVGADGVGVVIKSTTPAGGQIASVRRPHKSMEFLLDKENQKEVLPPENELQKSHENNPVALSEHQLRIQASLQRLNIPEWFRQYNQSTARSPDGGGGISGYKPGNFTRKRTTESGRWAGLNSKTTSLSSLGSQRSDRSPLLLSPSAHSHHGGQTTTAAGVHQQHHPTAGSAAYGAGAQGGAFSRWSTSHLNSSQTSPSVSQRGSFSRGGPINSSFMSMASGNSSVIRNSFRQPYLGWRSTEKLSQRTPHERLASSLLAQQQRTSPTSRTPTNGGIGDKLQPVTPEIQTSIKEVTSAIVHYVNDHTHEQRSRSTSPNSRKCWLESSFVGIRPLDSPQTPIIENTATPFSAAATATNNNNNNNNNSYAYLHQQYSSPGRIPAGSATNSDVLLRMNGLSTTGESAIYV